MSTKRTSSGTPNRKQRNALLEATKDPIIEALEEADTKSTSTSTTAETNPMKPLSIKQLMTVIKTDHTRRFEKATSILVYFARDAAIKIESSYGDKYAVRPLLIIVENVNADNTKDKIYNVTDWFEGCYDDRGVEFNINRQRNLIKDCDINVLQIGAKIQTSKITDMYGEPITYYPSRITERDAKQPKLIKALLQKYKNEETPFRLKTEFDKMDEGVEDYDIDI